MQHLKDSSLYEDIIELNYLDLIFKILSSTNIIIEYKFNFLKKYNFY